MLDPRLVHFIFLRKEFTEFHRKLYELRLHGVSLKGKDDDKADATIVLALSQAVENKTIHPVFILVPENMKPWVISRIAEMAKTCTQLLRSNKRKNVSLPGARNLVASLHLSQKKTSQLFVMAEPERWVAIGYSKSDPIPEWMQNGLYEGISQ